MLIRRDFRSVVVLLVLLSSVACANKYGRLAQISKETSAAFVKLQDAEIKDYREGLVSIKNHKEAQETFIVVGELIKGLNASIRISSAAGVRHAGSEIANSMTKLTRLFTLNSGLQVLVTIIANSISTMLAMI
jgi:hypothetical protein